MYGVGGGAGRAREVRLEGRGRGASRCVPLSTLPRDSSRNRLAPRAVDFGCCAPLSAPPLPSPAGSELLSGACPAYLRLTVVHSASSSGGGAAAAGAGAEVARAARGSSGGRGRHLCGAGGTGVGWVAAAALSHGRSRYLPTGILLFPSTSGWLAGR